jgi:hypothetical protein
LTAFPKRYDNQKDRFARIFQLTVPGSGSILDVAETILIDRIIERITGGLK